MGSRILAREPIVNCELAKRKNIAVIWVLLPLKFGGDEEAYAAASGALELLPNRQTGPEKMILAYL